MNWTQQQYDDYLRKKQGGVEPVKPETVKPSKFHNHITEMDNIRFHSQKEANYYADLVLRVKAGEVKFFLRQVPLYLPNKVRHVVDFVEFWADGSVHFVEVKGFDTPTGKTKRKIAEGVYPIRIEVV